MATSTRSEQDPEGIPPARVVRGGTVQFFPSPDGVTRIVGFDHTGEWFAEFACRAELFPEHMVSKMEQFIEDATGARITIV